MTPSERFWNFSVRTYRTEGVPAACLSLQDERGADVNVLLYCMWLGATRGEFDDEVYGAAMRYSEEWSANVVAALRRVRTWMKLHGCHSEPTPREECMVLREKVKGVEFAAEKMQEEVLESLVAHIPTAMIPLTRQVDAMSKNLRRYCADKEIRMDDWCVQRLARIAGAAVEAPDAVVFELALKVRS